MIIYNFRANGPYEYDKFMLNYGQLYNLAKNAEADWQASEIHTQNEALSEMIHTAIFEDNILEQAAMIQRIVTE